MIGLKRRRRDENGKRDGIAEHRTAGHDVPSSCPTEILRRLVSCLCTQKPKAELWCYTGRETKTADGVRGVSKQSFGAGVLVSACAGNRGWGYADSNDGRREVLPRIPSGVGPGRFCVCVSWRVLLAGICVTIPMRRMYRSDERRGRVALR